MLLKDQIDTARKMIRVHEREIETLKDEIKKLEEQRHSCEHEFSTPPDAYKHKGGVCQICGINEIHAASARIGKQYQGS